MSGFGHTRDLKSITVRYMDKIDLEWDHYSDQPHIIKDRALKKRIYRYALPSMLKTISTNILLSPMLLFRYLTYKCKKPYKIEDSFFGMGVDATREPDSVLELLDELGISTILVRVPLSRYKDLSLYIEFIEKNSDREVIISLIQERAFIDDRELLKDAVTTIFQTFSTVKKYQVANAINRKKWAFFGMDEYLSYHKTIQQIRDKSFKDIKLLGSGVIDFEYHYTVRTLFNLYAVKYDIFTALLYVDRRGSPQNRQMGFDLLKKIKLLKSLTSLSKKSSNTLYITETNWPIINTAPYAPTSPKECVDLEDYSFFMVLYHLIALVSGEVERVYWHQLIAPGYGLIDNRDGIKKYPAFWAYKTMREYLSGAKILSFDLNSSIRYIKCDRVEVYWSDKEFSMDGVDIYGNKTEFARLIYKLL